MLTLKETKVALEGVTIGGKTLREHFEAINHRDAILLVEDLVQKQQTLDEWTIKSLHQLVLKNIDADNAGRYHQQNVMIAGADHRPPADESGTDESRLPGYCDSGRTAAGLL